MLGSIQLAEQGAGAVNAKSLPCRRTSIGGFLHSRIFLKLVYILWHGGFELLSIKKVVKRNPKPITEKFDSNDARIVAVPIDNVL